MKRLPLLVHSVLLLSTLATLVVLATGCGGTETGNPTPGLSANGAANADGGSTSEDILSAICNKLFTCDGLATAQCLSGLYSQTNIAPALGLSAAYGNFQKVVDDEASNQITANALHAATCVSDIDALSCSSSVVTSAYSSAAPTDYTNVVNLIPTTSTSCEGVF